MSASVDDHAHCDDERGVARVGARAGGRCFCVGYEYSDGHSRGFHCQFADDVDSRYGEAVVAGSRRYRVGDEQVC